MHTRWALLLLTTVAGCRVVTAEDDPPGIEATRRLAPMTATITDRAICVLSTEWPYPPGRSDCPRTIAARTRLLVMEDGPGHGPDGAGHRAVLVQALNGPQAGWLVRVERRHLRPNAL